jgi:hypothetical protein
VEGLHCRTSNRWVFVAPRRDRCNIHVRQRSLIVTPESCARPPMVQGLFC